MSSLCFGSYASLYKNAVSNNNANNVVVPLLFGAIDDYYRTGNHDASDCGKWLKAKRKLPSAIASPVNPLDPQAVENYFTETVLPRITDQNKRNIFHQNLYSLVAIDTNIDEQTKNDLLVALINKQYAFFNSRIFLYAITQSNIFGVNLDDIELLPLPETPKIESTLHKNKHGDTGFNHVFIPVAHNEALNLNTPNFIRLFRLDVANSVFVFDNLNDFLEKNIGRYVFSRAMHDRLIDDGHYENIGKKAVEQLKKAGGFDDAKIGEELGDIILYTLLEQNLTAPKVYNKIEITGATGISAVNQGGVHLLTLNDTETSFQVVVAKSNIVGNLQTVIDNAFSAIVTAERNTSNEYKLLDSSVLGLSFSPQIAEHLRSIIIPTKRKTGISVQNAFGVFLGYSVGIDGSALSVDEFKKVAEAKMAVDIKNQIAYITQKIAAANLGGYSFYFYLIPFNDANCEKIAIMRNLVGGSV